MMNTVRSMLVSVFLLLCAFAPLPATAQAPSSDAGTGPTAPMGLQPFAPGDVFVGATLLNNPNDDHAGVGRIIQYDADLNLKGVLMVDGTTHLVNGLTFGPDGTLWAFDLWARVALRVTPEGEQLPNRRFAERPLAKVHFLDDGTMLLAEALVGDAQPLPLTTRYPVLPGEATKVGDGKLYRYDDGGMLLDEYMPDLDGGVTGSFAISHSVLSADRESLIYVSETGARLMRYDFANARQLTDVRTHPEGQVNMYFDLESMSGGQLLVSMGNRLERVSESGELVRVYPLARFGWAVVALSPDEAFAYVGNWFSGELARIDLADGAVAGSTTVCIRCMADLTVYSPNGSGPHN